MAVKRNVKGLLLKILFTIVAIPIALVVAARTEGLVFQHDSPVHTPGQYIAEVFVPLRNGQEMAALARMTEIALIADGVLLFLIMSVFFWFLRKFLAKGKDELQS